MSEDLGNSGYVTWDIALSYLQTKREHCDAYVDVIALRNLGYSVWRTQCFHVRGSGQQWIREPRIFLLAVRTGMRASDISGLKLSDICWTEKTIRVVQKKTKVTLLLPLPIDAGNAIADYILHSRPRTDNPYVFVRKSLCPAETVQNFLKYATVSAYCLYGLGLPDGQNLGHFPFCKNFRWLCKAL